MDRMDRIGGLLLSSGLDSALLQPSFRRKPESMLAGSITVVESYDAGFRLSPE